jgi:hypothetical protein
MTQRDGEWTGNLFCGCSGASLPAGIGGIMGHADQTYQARSRARVRELRSPVSGWEAVEILLLG